MSCAIVAAGCSSEPTDADTQLADAANVISAISSPPIYGGQTTTSATLTRPTLAESEAARLKRLSTLNTLASLPRAELPQAQQTILDEHLDILGPIVELDRYHLTHANGPRAYLLTDRDGAHVELKAQLTHRQVNTRDEAEQWLTALSDGAAAIRSDAERLSVELQSGAIPPAYLINLTLDRLSPELDPTREPAILRHFRTSLEAVEEIPDYERVRLLDEARTNYAQTVVPELTTIRDLLANARDQAGPITLSASRNGAERYRALFAYYAHPAVPPREIADAAEAEIQHLTEQLAALAIDGIDPEAPVGASLSAIQTAETQGSEPEAAPSFEALAARVNLRFDWARSKLAQMISKGGVRPIRIAPDEEAGSDALWPIRHTASKEASGSDGLAINIGGFADWPDWSLPVLSYAAGLPGTHLINSRRVLATPSPEGAGAALADGWALYAAGLAADLGGYDDRQLDRVGYIQFRLLHASLARTDIGIHEDGWTREEAVTFLRDRSGLSTAIVDKFADELIRRPARLGSAFAGMTAIMNYRDRADTRLGPRFDIRQFHDTILDGGPRPLTTVERQIEAWMTATQAAGQTE